MREEQKGHDVISTATKRWLPLTFSETGNIFSFYRALLYCHSLLTQLTFWYSLHMYFFYKVNKSGETPIQEEKHKEVLSKILYLCKP